MEMEFLLVNILFDIIIILISYSYGKHRGEVDKHKEIFDLFRDVGLMPPEVEE